METCPVCSGPLVERQGYFKRACFDCSSTWRADDDGGNVRELVERHEPLVFEDGRTGREHIEEYRARKRQIATVL